MKNVNKPSLQNEEIHDLSTKKDLQEVKENEVIKKKEIEIEHIVKNNHKILPEDNKEEEKDAKSIPINDQDEDSLMNNIEELNEMNREIQVDLISIEDTSECKSDEKNALRTEHTSELMLKNKTSELMETTEKPKEASKKKKRTKNNSKITNDLTTETTTQPLKDSPTEDKNQVIESNDLTTETTIQPLKDSPTKAKNKLLKSKREINETSKNPLNTKMVLYNMFSELVEDKEISFFSYHITDSCNILFSYKTTKII